MTDPIVCIDTSDIRHGKADDVKTAVRELAAFVEVNEPDVVAYGIYIDDDKRMTVLQIHPSSDSMELHMELAGPIFRKFADLLELSRVDFYGRPSARLLEQMQAKARLLGNAPVVVNELQAGFDRFSGAERDIPTRSALL